MTAAQVSNIPISIDYTGRDYYSLREQLITRIQSRIPNWTATDPADFGLALVEAFAYLGDLIAFYIDRSANEAFLDTATQRDSILNIAQTYGYIPSGYRQASLTIEFSNTSANAVTIPEGTIVSAQITVGDTTSPVYFTTAADAIVPAAVGESPGTYTVLALEGRSVTAVAFGTNEYGELVGTSDGSPNQSFELGETPVVDNSLQLYVKDGDLYSKWTEAQHIIDYGPTDLVYTVTSNKDNIVSVNFGDGVSGVIPTQYAEIRVLYTVGGGTSGNIASSTIDTIEFVPGLSELQVAALQSYMSVTNTNSGLGGSDPEDDAQIRISAPAALRALNRAVTLKDYSDLAVSVSGVGKANATAAAWSSVTVYIAPSRTALDTDIAPGLDDNGDPTLEMTTLQSNVSEFLSDKILIGSTVSVQPPTYVDCTIELEYAKLNQYSTAEVETAIKQTIVTAYGYNGMKFEDTIYPQDLEYVLQQTRGVKTARVLALHRQGGSGLNTLTGTPEEIFRFQETNINITTI